MKARKLLENAALGPDQLSILFQVFDEVWESIKGQYDTRRKEPRWAACGWPTLCSRHTVTAPLKPSS